MGEIVVTIGRGGFQCKAERGCTEEDTNLTASYIAFPMEMAPNAKTSKQLLRSSRDFA